MQVGFAASKISLNLASKLRIFNFGSWRCPLWKKFDSDFSSATNWVIADWGIRDPYESCQQYDFAMRLSSKVCILQKNLFLPLGTSTMQTVLQMLPLTPFATWSGITPNESSYYLTSILDGLVKCILCHTVILSILIPIFTMLSFLYILISCRVWT